MPSSALAPTVIKGATENEPILKEEIFGPIMPVRSVKSADEAISTINRVCARPLALYVFAENDEVVQHILARTNSGGVCINSCVEHILGHSLPFGGVGESGQGSYHGKFGFDEFSHRRGVMWKDSKILKKAIPWHHVPPNLYNIAVKAQVIGFLSKGQKQFAQIFLAAAIAAVAMRSSRL